MCTIMVLQHRLVLQSFGKINHLPFGLYLAVNQHLCKEWTKGVCAVSVKSKIPLFVLLTFWLACTSAVSAIEQNIPLSQSKGGTLYLEATLESNIKASFLLDTGSSLLTLNQATFDALTKNQKLLATRTSAARMANGKIVKISQYQLNSVRIGNTCEVGPVEVAVLPKGNNILGINTLLRVAPLTITPDAVILAGCEQCE